MPIRSRMPIAVMSITLSLAAVAGFGDAFDERVAERELLVERTIEARGVSDPDVLRAMRRVPRHAFIPERQSRNAYQDYPLPIGHGQTISQPYIVAYMTEVLEIEEGESVLEIGTGSGYQAAVLAEITSRVYSVEIIPELAESARRNLDALGYTHVMTKQGDGYYGWSEYAPYDAIIVTAAADHVPPRLIAQLGPGGVMIIPVGTPQGIQTLIRIRKLDDGTVERDGLMYVRFVPFTRERE